MTSKRMLRRLALGALLIMFYIMPVLAAAYPTLRQEDSGEGVRALQQALTFVGFPVKADGKYGLLTVEAVQRFQVQQQLKADGVAGNLTQTALFQLAPQFAPSAVAAPATPASQTEKLALGSQGAAVQQLQARLTVLGYDCARTDGLYDQVTQQAVAAFQRRNGLSADGVAGPLTLVKLYAPDALPNQPSQPLPQVTQTPNAVAALDGSATLRLGAQGPAVAQLQQHLKAAGFDCGRGDGVFDHATQAALMRFQGQYGFKADGVAGPVTLAALAAGGLSAPSAVPTIPPVLAPADALARIQTAPGRYVNLRRSAGSAQRNIIGKLPAGTIVQVIGQQGSWTQVRYQNQDGFVLTSFLNFQLALTAAPVVTPAIPSVTPTPSGPSGYAVVATQGKRALNFRISANTRDRNIIGTIPNGTTLEVLAQQGAWTQVRYQGQAGYVMASFLKSQAASPTPPADTPVVPSVTPAPAGPSGYAVVATQGKRSLNFRSSATASVRNIIGTIPNGTTLEVLARQGAWTQVRYQARDGYVMTSFLNFTQPTATSSPTLPPLPSPSVGPSVPPSAFPRILRQGDSGEDVRLLQEKLAQLKYTVSATATFDAATVQAVRAFQAQNSLTADGIFGTQSAALLLSGNARAADSAPLSYTTLRIDQSSEGVNALQSALKNLGYDVTVNGVFDIRTHEAVVGFQRRNGLTVSGIANPAMQGVLFGGSAKGASAPMDDIGAGEGKGENPGSGNVKLLHWYKDIRPSFSGGQSITVYDPSSGLSWDIRFYSMGAHADSEPKTLRDTLIMNRAFGTPSWNIHPVYVKLPNGVWTLASMHNRPHLTGSITDNGFGGHLCIHFLRDLEECSKNDPNFGMANQRIIRSAWKNMTGQDVP